MQDLTKFYKSLYAIHDNKRKEGKMIIIKNSKNLDIIKPVIIFFVDLQSLKYSNKHKILQQELVKEIKLFLYYKKDPKNVLLKILSTNKKLVDQKTQRIESELVEQTKIDQVITYIINQYIKQNILAFSLLKDICVIYQKKELRKEEYRIIEEIVMKVQKIYTPDTR